MFVKCVQDGQCVYGKQAVHHSVHILPESQAESEKPSNDHAQIAPVQSVCDLPTSTSDPLEISEESPIQTIKHQSSPPAHALPAPHIMMFKKCQKQTLGAEELSES